MRLDDWAILDQNILCFFCQGQLMHNMNNYTDAKCL